MKQFYEEARHLCHWCFCCPHTDMAEQIEREEKGQTEERTTLHVLDLFAGCSGLVKSIIDVPDAATLSMGNIDKTVSETIRGELGDLPNMIASDQSEEDKWNDWNEHYEMEWDEPMNLRCPYIRKKGLTLNVDREFVVPEDEKEILRLLDQISQCYPEECRYNRREHWGIHTLNYLMKRGIAKIDFALIERGLDFGKLMHEMYFPYYERKEDLGSCGYSWDLIRYYLDKYGIQLKSNEEYEAEDSRPQVSDFESKQEYKDALADEVCDKNGKLLIKKSEYTRYAVKKYGIKSSYKQFWTRFDNIFSDDSGKVISFRTFMQSFRDQDLG